MISKDAVRELLLPFDSCISGETLDKVIAYLELLLRWNRKINLTSIPSAEECITRHFGESFLVSRVVKLRGSLLDIGSGAGFPGLALRLIEPKLNVVLLEPVAKKRAFLKEVARACSIGEVQVLGSRLEEFVREEQGRLFDFITARAVGGLELLIPAAKCLLGPNGHLCFWVGTRQIQGIREADAGILWQAPLAIPQSHDRHIMVGVPAVTGQSNSFLIY